MAEGSAQRSWSDVHGGGAARAAAAAGSGRNLAELFNVGAGIEKIGGGNRAGLASRSTPAPATPGKQASDPAGGSDRKRPRPEMGEPGSAGKRADSCPSPAGHACVTPPGAPRSAEPRGTTSQRGPGARGAFEPPILSSRGGAYGRAGAGAGSAWSGQEPPDIAAAAGGGGRTWAPGSRMASLLKGIVFAISGEDVQEPERSAVRRAAMAMGAKYKAGWSANDCSVLLCARPHTPDFKRVKKEGGHIVSKEWVTKCVQEEKMVSIDLYSLYYGLGSWRHPRFDAIESDNPSDEDDVQEVAPPAVPSGRRARARAAGPAQGDPSSPHGGSVEEAAGAPHEERDARDLVALSDGEEGPDATLPADAGGDGAGGGDDDNDDECMVIASPPPKPQQSQRKSVVYLE
eukprot:jgi/Mesen1/5008/ME000025S04405